MSRGDLVAHEDDGWVAPEGFNFTRDVVEYYATDPRRTALTFVDGDGVIERRSFAQIAADAARWAHVLRGSGYQPGDRVLVLLGNVPESTGILLGAIKGGLVTVPCPAPMPARDVALRARRTGASLLIADRSAEADVDEMRSRLDAELDVLFLDEAERLLKRCRPVAPTEATAPDHHPFVLHTSGVTKEPKGVAHTHAATYAARWQAKHWLDVGSRDIVWCAAGNWWGHSIWNVLGCWSFGAEIVMHAGGFDPAERLELLEFLGVSILGQTAAEYRPMGELDQLEARRPSRLRHAVSAGDPLSPDVVARFREAFGISICDGYGQAENALLLAAVPSRALQPGSLGSPVPGHHVAVIDEDGREMPLGEAGEIGLQGRPPTLFDHYWGSPEETQAAFRGPWYLTGDRAARDEDGSFWFLGRTDDVIVGAEHRVGAFEVECALRDHPAVAESAVVGKPGSDRDQIVKAFVVLRAGLDPTDDLADELRLHARRDPVAFAHPREIEFVTELPRTSDGKLRRIELRRLELHRAGVAAPHPGEEAHAPPPDDDRRGAEDGRGRHAKRRRAAKRELRTAAKAAKQLEKAEKRAEKARAREEVEQRRRAAAAERQAAESARQAEVEAKRAEEARLRAAADEEARLEKEQRRAEQEARKAEAERQRADAEERRTQEEARLEAEKQARRDAKRAEEAEQARLRAEPRRLRAEAKESARLEEAQRRADAEARKAEESRVRAEAKEQARLEEAQRRADAEARKAEESRVRAEAKEQARLQEAQRRAEEDLRRRAAEEEREAERQRGRVEQERLRSNDRAARARAEGRPENELAASGGDAVSAEALRAEEETARAAEAEHRREVEAARRMLEESERKRRRTKRRSPERAVARVQPEDEESDLGVRLLERLEAYGHGGEPRDDA
jgi:acyl-coenzyme A synthetase/AMP-(fatty) acid ligase